MFDNLLINGIILFFPFLVYLFYISSNLKIRTREKNIFQFLIMIISFLILLKFGHDFKTILVLLNIPLLFALMNKNYFSYISLASFLVVINRGSILSIFVLILNYVLVALINYKVKNKYVFLTSFLLLNSFTYLYIFGMSAADTAILSFVMLSVIFYILYSKGNEIIGFNRELNELQKEKEIRKSLFKITHEIKNPIAVCKAYLDMFDITNIKKCEKYINIIKGEIERLLCLLEDFMLVNKSSINPDIMDINLLIEDKVSTINDLMNSKNVNIKYDLIDDDVYIFGDYNRLSQVFINLIKNSIEAKAHNILFKCSVVDKKVIIDIKDDGQGITNQNLKKIKEPFYTTKLKGTGLGVSLCYEIIEAHNGKLKYTSTYGTGTDVKITLPLLEM